MPCEMQRFGNLVRLLGFVLFTDKKLFLLFPLRLSWSQLLGHLSCMWHEVGAHLGSFACGYPIRQAPFIYGIFSQGMNDLGVLLTAK